MESVSYTAAFIAGVLSITSPCILPVLPLYVAYLAGTSDRAATTNRAVLINAMCFIVGFSLVFVLIGTAFGFLGTAMAERKTLLMQVGGLLLIVFGLQQIGLFELPMPGQRWARMQTGGHVSPFQSGIVGMTFAAGWTPCAGPILGAILTLALSRGDAGKATMLLSVYSLGLAIPFFAIALIGTSSRILGMIAQRSAAVAPLAGAVMLAVGLIMVLGIYQSFFARIVATAPWSPIEPSFS